MLLLGSKLNSEYLFMHIKALSTVACEDSKSQ